MSHTLFGESAGAGTLTHAPFDGAPAVAASVDNPFASLKNGTGSSSSTSGDNPFNVLNTNSGTTAVPSKLPLTVEQEAIRDGFLNGEDMVISAGAGTGKTSSLVALSEALYAADQQARGVYIAFNKSIATEVGGKFTYSNIQGMTVHSLAYRGSMRIPHIEAVMHRLNSDAKPPKAWERPKLLKIQSKFEFARDESQPMNMQTNPLVYATTGQTMVTAAMEAITKFCQSADDKVGPQHVRLSVRFGKDLDNDIKRRLKLEIVKVAQHIWDTDLTQPNGVLKFSYDTYLKMFCLTRPDISTWFQGGNRKPVLFFDEAQDGRPCITQLIMDQRDRMQIVLCGDSSQAIYRFTGCEDAIRGFKAYPNVKHYSLTRTFRFGPAIASVANRILDSIDGSDVRIVPDLSIKSKVTVGDVTPQDANAIICRSNGEVIEAVMEALSEGRRVYSMADTQRIAYVAEDYLRVSHGEKAWMIEMKGFNSTDDIEKFLKTPSDELSDDEDELDKSFVSILRAVHRLGAHSVLKALSGVESSENNADVTISTIHKSKGRQWDSVFVRWDVTGLDKLPPESKSLNDELMLLYVAVTRAKLRLKVDASVTNVATVLSTTYSTLSDNTQYAASIGTDLHTSVSDEMDAGSVAPHRLSQAIVFVQDMFTGKLTRWDRSKATHAIVSEVGLLPLLEAMDLAVESDLPAELVGAMLEIRGVTSDDLGKFVKKLLDSPMGLTFGTN